MVLISWIRRKYLSVRRYEEREYIKRPIYIVCAHWKDNRNDIYLIDGINGETLYTQKAVEIIRDDSPTDWKSIEELYHDSKSSSSIPMQQ